MSDEQVEQTCAICEKFVSLKVAKFVKEYGSFFDEHMEVYCDECLTKGE